MTGRRPGLATGAGIALAAAMAGAVVAGLLSPHSRSSAQAVSNPASQGQSRITDTQVIVFEPWTSHGLAPSLHVASTVNGSCWSSSIATTRPDAYRCMAGNDISDPCFANPHAAAGYRQVACPYPGTDSMIVINLTKPLPAPTTAQQAQPSAWLIVLANGQSCDANTGAGGLVAGLRLSFGCPSGSLYGQPDQSNRTWTISYQARGSSGLTRVPIAKAYE